VSFDFGKRRLHLIITLPTLCGSEARVSFGGRLDMLTQLIIAARQRATALRYMIREIDKYIPTSNVSLFDT
jgi:hypothetical protein